MKFMRHNVRHGKEEAKEGKGVEGFMSQERWPKLGYICNAKDRLGSSLPRHKSLQLLITIGTISPGPDAPLRPLYHIALLGIGCARVYYGWHAYECHAFLFKTPPPTSLRVRL
nr:hypothetical protein CFP56_53472 [Quercus suber]